MDHIALLLKEKKSTELLMKANSCLLTKVIFHFKLLCKRYYTEMRVDVCLGFMAYQPL